MNKSRPRGRPAGGSSARADILAAARRRFLTDGYHQVTLRAIAAEAGVDPALISYHFGSKRGLLGEAMALAVNPADLLAREIAGPLNNLPERLLTTVLTAWDDPETSGSLRTFIEAVVGDPDVGRVFRELVEHEMLPRIAERIGGRDATRRASVAASHIAGIVMARYLLQLEPFASMPRAEVVRRMAPGLRAVLIGPAPAPRRG
jgi:AcrR family transcriptional regulator